MGYLFLTSVVSLVVGVLLTAISFATVARSDERPRETLFRIFVQGIARYTLFISVTKRTRRGQFGERVEQYLMRERTQLALGYTELDRYRKEFDNRPSWIKEQIDEVQNRQRSCDYAFGLALLAGYGKIVKKVAETKIVLEGSEVKV